MIGGGFTGLWTALLAKEFDPERSVVLVEGNRVGWAASGRNGGSARRPSGCYLVSPFLAGAPFAAPSNGLIASAMRSAHSTWEVSRCSAKS